MAKRKIKSKGNATTAASFSLKDLGKSWQDKSPVLKYLGGFVGLLAIFYAIYSSSFFETWILGPFLNVQTSISSVILNIFGMGTTADGSMLIGRLTSLNVAKGCDGMEASALFLIGVLLMPFTWRNKMAGLAAGVGVLFLLNIVRIIGLYFAKIYWPSAFETLHIHGGFALFTIVAILLWAGWAGWAMKREKPANV